MPAIALSKALIPAPEKQATKAAAKQAAAVRAADTIAGLSEQFLELYAKPRTRARTYQQSQDVLRRLVQPAWRSRTVHEIRRRDVIALVDEITRGTERRWRTRHWPSSASFGPGLSPRCCGHLPVSRC